MKSTTQTVLGAYTTEKLAEEIAERASPGEWEMISTVVDEVPDWLDELEYEEQREAKEELERLQNRHNPDGAPLEPATPAPEPG